MERGERILVRAYPDRILERVFLEGHGTYVLVCRPEVYDVARTTGIEPDASMGFPIEDIVDVHI